MTNAISHRGPDDFGIWCDEAAGLALGHRRLSVIDTSPAGHQPMLSENGRFVLTFNGEIYNHRSLREDLSDEGAAPQWRGHSDTETLLAAITHWGLAKTLHRATGMFALALWDRKARHLQLARDRVGEKPLYYGWAGKRFVFGSEIKAIMAYPGFEARPCQTALQQYLRFAYVPGPRSIWEGLYKLEPGCILAIDGSTPPVPQSSPLRPGQKVDGVNMSRYWSLAEVTTEGHRNPLRDETEALGVLEKTLATAVSQQAISDVPLGAFLSGGIDSSLVVALLQKNSGRPVRTFTIGFEEEDFDESQHAAAVAKHLGTDHTEIRVTSAEARTVIPRLPALFDEPFADASQIPTYLVCGAARPHVTVALTGDGGDEFFGGYPRYERAPKLWNMFKTIPFPVRKILGRATTSIPAQWWDRLAGVTNMALGPSQAASQAGGRIHRTAERIGTVQSIDDLYLNLVSSWPDPQAIVADPNAGGKSEISMLLADPLPLEGAEHPASRMMYQDALTYLPDDILCKVDRAAMGVSLETRAPLLDPHVIMTAARLPVEMKLRDGEGKWALRQILYKHVPRELIERPKRGFFLPVGQWLRGPLRDWAESLLDPAKLAHDGLLRVKPVRRVWDEHVSGRRDWTLQVWTVLMLQAWADAHSAGRA